MHKDRDFEQNLENIRTSDEGRAVLAASKYPLIMQHGPTLLPEQFTNLFTSKARSILGSRMVQENILQNLQEIIQDNVWKLGFSCITSRELGLVNCESNLEAFKQCELHMEELHMNALRVYHEIKRQCRRWGHTYVKTHDIRRQMQLTDEEIMEAIKFLKTHEILVAEDTVDLFLDIYLRSEKGIATCLGKLSKMPLWMSDLTVDKVIEVAERESDGQMQFDTDQKSALQLLCHKNVVAISGNGGCGKTSVVSRYIEATLCDLDHKQENSKCGHQKRAQRKYPEILLTAPTGRAATVLRKKTRLRAYTLHQVLFSYWIHKNEPGFPENWLYAETQVLVVDEGSLVSVKILYCVLEALEKHAKLNKFIIMGDVKQLPSIDPGNTLVDIFQSLKEFRCAIELTTNHRSESQLIVDNAARIWRKEMPQFDAEIDINAIDTASMMSDKRFMLVPLTRGTNDELKEVIEVLKRFVPGLQDASSSQFITFKNDDCDFINNLCCTLYSSHQMKFIFSTGDKVCCTKNGNVSDFLYVKDSRSKEPSKDFVRLHNGEIMFIEKDEVEKNDKRYLTLNNGDDYEVKASCSALRKDCKLRHAWARTIHTYQSSEVPTLVYVMTPTQYQNVQHLYTAVTRGYQRVYIVAERNVLESVLNKPINKRKTKMQERLKKALRWTGHKRPRSPAQPQAPAQSPDETRRENERDVFLPPEQSEHSAFDNSEESTSAENAPDGDQ
ncbi:HELB helicase, partial [Amia calva]|nr:HELB helicase [Amia calva]